MRNAEFRFIKSSISRGTSIAWCIPSKSSELGLVDCVSISGVAARLRFETWSAGRGIADSDKLAMACLRAFVGVSGGVRSCIRCFLRFTAGSGEESRASSLCLRLLDVAWPSPRGFETLAKAWIDGCLRAIVDELW